MYDLAKILWICTSEVVRISHLVKYVRIAVRSGCLFSSGWKELRFQLKHRYVASLILHASIATAMVFILCVAYLTLSDDGWIINHDFFVQINILEGSWLFSLNGVSVTISYSSCCLTTETEKNIPMKTVLLRI